MIRTAASVASLAVAPATAGCMTATEGHGAPAEPAPTSSAAPLEPVPTSSAKPLVDTPQVQNPKDVRTVATCDLLTPSQLTGLGLKPETARPTTSGTARICTWTSTVAGEAAGVTLATNLAIGALENLYVVRNTFQVFEPGEVTGHPSVRADNGNGCTLYVAIADDQLMSADGHLGGPPLPDPCARSRRMAELVLSNLPDLH